MNSHIIISFLLGLLVGATTIAVGLFDVTRIPGKFLSNGRLGMTEGVLERAMSSNGQVMIQTVIQNIKNAEAKKSHPSFPRSNEESFWREFMSGMKTNLDSLGEQVDSLNRERYEALSKGELFQVLSCAYMDGPEKLRVNPNSPNPLQKRVETLRENIFKLAQNFSKAHGQQGLVESTQNSWIEGEKIAIVQHVCKFTGDLRKACFPSYNEDRCKSMTDEAFYACMNELKYAEAGKSSSLSQEQRQNVTSCVWNKLYAQFKIEPKTVDTEDCKINMKKMNLINAN